MHRKTYVVTTTILGGLFCSVPVFAQSTMGQAAHDTAQGVRTGAHEAAQGVRTGTQRTGDAVRNTAYDATHPDTTRDIHTSPQTTTTTATRTTTAQPIDSTRARGGGETAAAGCPAGCVAVRHYTPEQVAAWRRARQERRDRLAAERADAERNRTDLENCRTNAQRLEAEAQQLRSDAERERLAALERQRADADRIARLQQDLAVRVTPVAVVQRRRGGGPNMDHHNVHVQFGLDGGLGGLTGPAQNNAWVGPAWGARVGMHFMNWFGVEARYFGMHNDGYDPRTGPNVGLVTNEVSGLVRLQVPTPYVRPYALGGAGVAWTNVTVWNGGNVQASTLRDSRSGVVPMGGGIDVPIGRRWGVGFEGLYHYFINQRFSTDPSVNNGGQWSTSANIHVSI